MNPRIAKVCAEIDRTKARISEQQSRLRELERQKTELENTDIVALVRSVEISPQELAEFIRAYKAHGQVHGQGTDAPSYLPIQEQEENDDE